MKSEPHNEPLLVSKAEARRMLGNIGSTKFDSMISSGVISSVKIGSRRFAKIASVRRLAGVKTDQSNEA